MDILSTLFGSSLRVKMMRLFLFNQDSYFDAGQVGAKTFASIKEVEKEADFLRKLGLIKASKVSKTILIKKGKKTIEKKGKVKVWTFDRAFKFAEPLTDFLVKTHPIENKAIVKKLEKAGKIKAVLVSGIFMRDAESRVDMFVVGDNIRNSSMERIVKMIESDMGKDIRYAVLSTPDFAYRKSMNDKLIRDVLDFPHTVLLDKIGLVQA